MDNLITVLIVDDEKLTIEDLSTLIDWEANGYKIVGTAFNGKQGIKKYRELKPQLIMTDIRMPFMDGIEMITEIRREDQDVSLLLLTAYEEFGYARAAIRLGITEYIMKNEITSETLTALLQNIKQSIKTQNKKKTIVTNQMLEEYFQSDTVPVENELKTFLGRNYTTLLIEQDCPVSINREPVDDLKLLSDGHIINELKGMNYYGYSVEAVFRYTSRRIVLLLGDAGTQLYAVHDDCMQIAKQIRENMRKSTAYSFSIYYFDKKISPDTLKEFLKNNSRVFQDKYFTNAGMTHRLSANEVLTWQEPAAVSLDENRLMDVLHIYDPVVMNTYFENISEIVCRSKSRVLFVQIVSEFYDLLQRINNQISFEKQIDIGIEKNGIYWTDVNSIFKWFSEQFYVINSYLLTNGKNYSKTIMDAMEYIHSHFSDPDLSMNEIAGHLHISGGYLSTVFKKETGVNLKNYITSVRIEAAKIMIAKGHLKIYEICTKVGYHSSQYFSQAFYKETGMLPTEYKEKE